MLGDVGYAAALLGGAATLLSPCALMLLPAFFALAFTSRAALLGRTGLFFLGLLTTLVPLGAAAGGIGGLLVTRRDHLITAAAVLVIVLGILQALAVPLPGIARRGSTRRDPGSPLAVYLLGTAYGVAGVCSGPILGAVLAVAAMGADPLYGAMLLVAYAAGMVIPLLLIALAWVRFDLREAAWLRPRPVRLGPVRTTVTHLVSGLLFVGVGVLLLVTEGTSALPGLLPVGTQQRLELALLGWGAHVPDLLVVGGLLALAGLAAWIALRPTRGRRG